MTQPTKLKITCPIHPTLKSGKANYLTKSGYCYKCKGRPELAVAEPVEDEPVVDEVIPANAVPEPDAIHPDEEIEAKYGKKFRSIKFCPNCNPWVPPIEIDYALEPPTGRQQLDWTYEDYYTFYRQRYNIEPIRIGKPGGKDRERLQMEVRHYEAKIAAGETDIKPYDL
jgi:hypothetical protein